MNTRTLFLTGMAICVAAAILMLAGILSVGWGSALGIIGVGVLGASASQRASATD